MTVGNTQYIAPVPSYYVRGHDNKTTFIIHGTTKFPNMLMMLEVAEVNYANDKIDSNKLCDSRSLSQ